MAIDALCANNPLTPDRIAPKRLITSPPYFDSISINVAYIATLLGLNLDRISAPTTVTALVFSLMANPCHALCAVRTS